MEFSEENTGSVMKARTMGRSIEIPDGPLRPTPEDRDALRLLLKREDMSDWNANFLESLVQWRGQWTDRQCQHFDMLCLEYFGEC